MPLNIRLQLLATPALHVGVAPPMRLAAKDALLLALLALDGTQPRDTLAQLLWPDAAPAGGRANLRQRLKKLQDLSGQALFSLDGPQLALAATVQHDLQGLTPALQGDALAAPGALLGHLQLQDCPAASDWLAQARARIDLQRQQALQAQAQSLEDSHQLDAAMPYAQRLVAEAPLQEHAWRRLMRLHYLRGDRSAALATYRQLAQALRQDGGHEPDAQTRALARLVEEGSAPAASAAPAPHTAAAWAALQRPPQLLQREGEWARLAHAWASGGTVLVLGEAGTGKSRLLNDFADSVGLALRLQARPGDAAVPYALLARWVTALAAQAPALPEWARGELARLLPALGPAAPGALMPLHLTQALALLQPPQNAVLLDDLHFADAASLELLPAVLGPLHCRLLAARSHELPEALQAWISTSGLAVEALHLAPWHAGSVRSLLLHSGLHAADADLPAWADLLWRHTGGHPLLLLETLRALLLSLPEGARPGSPPEQLPVPAQLLQLLGRRLAGLTAPAREVVQLASLSGSAFSAELAGAVLHYPVAALNAAWLELQAAAFMGPQRGLHDLVLAAARSTLAEPLAVSLHARIAEHGGRLGAPAAQLALHWEAAAQPARAAASHEAAARAAGAASRRHEEAAHYAAAARCWGQAGDAPSAFKARAEEAERRVRAGDVTQGQQLAETLVASATNLLEQAQAHRVHAMALTHASSWSAALAAAALAQTTAARSGQTHWQAEAALLRALAAAVQGQPALAERCLADEQALPMHGADWRQNLSRHAVAATVWTHLGRIHEALERNEQSIRLADRPEARDDHFVLLGNSAALLLRLGGRTELALQRAQQALQGAERLGVAAGMTGANVRMHVGLAAASLGRYALAVAELETCLHDLRALGLARVVLTAENHLASVWAQLGQPARALQLLQVDSVTLPLLHRVRRWTLRCDLQRLCGTGAPTEAAPPLDASVEPGVAAWARLAQARALPAAETLPAFEQLATEMTASRLTTQATLARLLHVQASAHTQPALALARARELQSELTTGPPNTAWWPEAHAVLHQVFSAAGEHATAQEVLAAGAAWLQATNAAWVPSPFQTGFLQRNRLHADLLRAEARSN